MIIQPKVRGFICTTAHPTGCAKMVEEQIHYAQAQGNLNGPKNALIIGASTGYGLATRASCLAANARTIGVFFEKPAEDSRAASAGWYNTAAFECIAHKHKIYAKSINGDAFSNAIKQQTADLIRADLGQIDLLIYSLASPRRIHPETSQVYSSVLKPIGKSFHGKTVDPIRGIVKDITIEPATEAEIADTVAVMGGEDWEMWVNFLKKENLLAPGVKTLAYTYLGPGLTHAIYKDGTIGRAKEDLQQTADLLNHQLTPMGGQALLSVNKALVTQASSAIPVVPLYISLLFKIMKEKGTHEGCIEQTERLFRHHLYASTPPPRDAAGRIRLDDLEMQPDVQQKIVELWPQITTENLNEITDVSGYLDDFYRLFGFNNKEINYNKDVDINIAIESI
jgi:enoyl-[acyl-carrier protein] reductase/trans-2-enoyl-CoA reductase (NAD+)